MNEQKKSSVGFIFGLLGIITGTFVLITTLLADETNTMNLMIGVIAVSLGANACAMHLRGRKEKS